MKKEFPYEDIINLPPHISQKYPQATMEDRAARFSPFAAITGYDDMVKEAARVTQERIELDESLKRILDDKLSQIQGTRNSAPLVTITHFISDTKKSGGAYIQTTGIIRRIDPHQRSIILKNGYEINIDDILDIES